MDKPSERYFAAEPLQKIGESICKRLANESQDDGARAERAQMFCTAYQHYYGFELGRGITHAIMRGGDAGELSEIRVNKARALASSLKSLVLGPQVTWRPQAANNNTNA